MVLLKYLCFILILSLSGCKHDKPLLSFSTNGHTIYHIKPAVTGHNGQRGIITAAYDGSILSYDTKGHLLWKTKPTIGFPFDLATGDLNKDGIDEALVASSDGNLYVINHLGQLIWTFKAHPPLYQVCIASDLDGKPIILTGGVDRILYTLSADGSVISSLETDGVIRLLAAGKIMGDKSNYAYVSTSRIALRGDFSLRLIDLDQSKIIWERKMSNKPDNMERFYSVQLLDMNMDGKLEAVFGMTHNKSDEITIFDHLGNLSILKTCTGLPQRVYKMNFLSHIKSESLNEEYFINLSGHNLLQFTTDGNCLDILPGPYSFAGAAFDPVTGIYWLGSAISGGDGIYGFHLDHPGWKEAFLNLKPIGKMLTLETNMAELLEQAKAFQPPSYQNITKKTKVIIEETPEVDISEAYKELKRKYIDPYQLKNLDLIPYAYSLESPFFLREYYDPGITDEKMRNEWENWHKNNNMPKEQILQFARDREAKDEDFFIFAGHGRSFGIDFYISPKTLAEMLELAPNTMQGLVFAELENTDIYLENAIKDQLLPLADLFYENGFKKILLRNKNIFWNGSVHLDLFKPLMAEEKYRETFVPSMEETNSRSQSLSQAGRLGLWLSGNFNHTSGRAVTDNANYNRLWEWGQTKRLSHFIRALSMNAILGADIFHINVKTDNAEEMLPFYLLLEKGILPIPDREDLISLSGLTIGIKNPDKEFIHHGANGHGIAQYTRDSSDFVFDRLACYWGGAPLAEHDFEYYALNAKRRMTNFITQGPYGNLTTISAETNLSDFPYFKKMLVTDGKYWYDEHNQAVSASAFKPVVVKALEEAASVLPLMVYGEVGWAAIRIDLTHVRIVLIDPGYLDPAERKAEIVFQHLNPLSATDILSGEKLAINERKLITTVPLGILRIIDVEHN